MQHIHTVIIGGGQAGLATSYHLQKRGVEHIVLEQADHPAHVWRDERWDSFALNSPNWASGLPGAEYEGDDPEGLIPRAEIIAYFDNYVKKYNLPVRCGQRATAVEPRPEGGWIVRTDKESWEADNVVIATGLFQTPKKPAFAGALSPRILQVFTSQYHNPADLPEGAVLVVGAGQSGMQIAADLLEAGRRVYLSVGKAPRVPRRYRGRDIFFWLKQVGFLDRTPDILPTPQARFMSAPQVSNRKDGPPVNVHYFARQGMQLLGRTTGGSGERLTFAEDLKENIARTDKLEAEMLANIDRVIAAKGIEAPQEARPDYQDGYAVEPVTELDLAASGISTIIWAQGYGFDFSLIKVPVTDPDGYPLQQRGVTEYPGLYFVGLPWLSKFQSGLLVGVGEDAEYIAEKIAG